MPPKTRPPALGTHTEGRGVELVHGLYISFLPPSDAVRVSRSLFRNGAMCADRLSGKSGHTDPARQDPIRRRSRSLVLKRTNESLCASVIDMADYMRDQACAEAQVKISLARRQRCETSTQLLTLQTPLPPS
ncbi:hypothetical protein VTO73DRAFT_9799 [Trametes versicolor]